MVVATLGAVATADFGGGSGNGFGGRGDLDDGAVFGEPDGAGALAADGRILFVADAGEAPDEPFEAGPESEFFEDGINDVGDGAVVGVFRVGVVKGVLVRRLEDAPVLELGDDDAVFLAGAVRPFVDFVGVHADGDEEPDLPGEDVERPRAGEHDGAEDEEIPGALEPGVAGEEARVVVVDDVGADQEAAEHGRIFGEVGVLGPVDEAGGEVGEGDDGEALQRDAEEREDHVGGGLKPALAGASPD